MGRLLDNEHRQNYFMKNQIANFPAHVVKTMLDYQEMQGNPRDATVFEKNKNSGYYHKGFDWDKTKEGFDIWSEIINHNKFHLIPNNNDTYPKLMEVECSKGDWAKRVVVLERVIDSKTYYYYLPYAESMEKALKSPTMYFTTSVREISDIPAFTKKEIAEKLGVPDFKIIEE